MRGFSITFEVITPESAEDGEVAESGFLEEGLTLRDAIEALRWDRGCYVDSNSYPVTAPRWFTFYETDHDYATGAVTNKALHLPNHLTPSTRRRIARLVGCYGAA